MKLQKLVYYAYGLSLAEGSCLVNEGPQVWKLGPVFNSLYFEMKYHGANVVASPEKEGIFGLAPMFDKNDKQAVSFVSRVWDKLKNFTAVQLSAKTHRPGTPWYETAKSHDWKVPKDTLIPEPLIKNYFRKHGLDG